MFVRNFGGEVIVLLNVDDIVVTSNNTCALPKLLMELRRLFTIKDLGPLHYFFGIEVKRTPSYMYLTQTKYVLDLVRRTDMHDAKPLKSPVQTGLKLSRYDGDRLSNAQEYCTIVGALQYITLTRPDIAFCSKVCQFMHDRRSTYWVAIKQILCFLKGTLTIGLHFRKGTFQVTVYSDANWAGDLIDRRSRYGYAIFIGT